MSSATSPVRDALEGYLAGRVAAKRVVAIVAEAYYREAGSGKREALRPLVEIIERAAPGGVELLRTEGGAGFGIKPSDRAFPKQYEPELRAAAEQMLRAAGTSDGRRGVSRLSLMSRIALAFRRLFR